MKKLFIQNLKKAITPHLKEMVGGMKKKGCNFCLTDFKKNELVAGVKETGDVIEKAILSEVMGKEYNKRVMGFGIKDILNSLLIEICEKETKFLVDTDTFGKFEFEILNENI